MCGVCVCVGWDGVGGNLFVCKLTCPTITTHGTEPQMKLQGRRRECKACRLLLTV